MGRSAHPAAAAIPSREPSQLVGHRFPQPAVEPAEGRAGAVGHGALDGSAAGPAAAATAPSLTLAAPRRCGTPRPAVWCAHPRTDQGGVHPPGAAEPHATAPARRGPLADPWQRGPPADRRRHRPAAATSPVAVRAGVKRRRANVLFVLVLIAACSLFLAATMQTESLYYVAGAAFLGLCAYVYVLAQRRKREIPADRREARRPPRLRRADPADELDQRGADIDESPAPERRRRSHGPTVRYEERPARTRRSPSADPTGARRRPLEPVGSPAAASRRTHRADVDEALVTGAVRRRPRPDDRSRAGTRRQAPARRSEVRTGQRPAQSRRTLVARRLTATTRRGRNGRRYTLGRPRGCSSVGRAQQSHC